MCIVRDRVMWLVRGRVMWLVRGRACQRGCSKQLESREVKGKSRAGHLRNACYIVEFCFNHGLYQLVSVLINARRSLVHDQDLGLFL